MVAIGVTVVWKRAEETIELAVEADASSMRQKRRKETKQLRLVEADVLMRPMLMVLMLSVDVYQNPDDSL